MKRGLKLTNLSEKVGIGVEVAVGAPMKRGLKHMDEDEFRARLEVAVGAPMKRGLKRRVGEREQQRHRGRSWCPDEEGTETCRRMRSGMRHSASQLVPR